MIQLFLDNVEVVVDGSTQIKLTRSNPYITKSGEYTLEVSIPLDIPQNSEFFAVWRRIEMAKLKDVFDARLVLDNRTLLDGSAKVTQATEQMVKVQLLAAASELERLHGEEYIDELLLPGYLYDDRDGYEEWPLRKHKVGAQAHVYLKPCSEYVNDGRGLKKTTTFLGDDPDKFTVFPVFDQRYGAVCNQMRSIGNNRLSVAPAEGFHDSQVGSPFTLPAAGFSPNWNLLFVVQSVFKAYGYKLTFEGFDLFLRRIYLAMPGEVMADALPHWTVSRFLDEVRTFFNAVFFFEGKNARMVPRSGVTLSQDSIQIAGGYTIENMNEGRTGENLSQGFMYNLSDVEDYHAGDAVDDDVLSSLETRDYSTGNAMRTAYNNASGTDKANCLWHCPDGYYCHWDGELQRVDIFGKQDKTGEVDTTELNIVPAAMADAIASDHFGVFHYTADGSYIPMPVLERILPETISQEEATAQAYITGNANVSEKEKKSDRMEVVFFDGRWVNWKLEKDNPYTEGNNTIPSAFTSCGERPRGVMHEQWSFSLEPRVNTDCVGDLYVRNILRYNARRKGVFKFLADEMPSADRIFIVNGKRFVAEKIEAGIKDGKLDPLMTGHFYELL